MMGYVALAVFVAVWAWVAWIGKTKSWTGTMRHGGGFLAGAVAAALFGSVFQIKPSPAPSEKVVGQSTAPEKGLGIEKEKFAYQWNSISHNKIGAIEFKDGVAILEMSDTRSLTLNSYNGNGRIDAVTLLLAPQTQLDALNVLLDIPAAIAATNPELTPPQRGEIMKKLRMVGDDADYSFENEKKPRAHIVGGVKYSFMRLADILVFGAEPAT